MTQHPALQTGKPAIDVAAIADCIARTQLSSGAIPWSEGDKTDPWDHVESAMGLAVGGHLAAARRAFLWLREMQLKRWRYALPTTLHPERYLLATGIPTLAFAGDAFGWPRVEGAALSGLTAGDALARGCQSYDQPA